MQDDPVLNVFAGHEHNPEEFSVWPLLQDLQFLEAWSKYWLLGQGTQLSPSKIGVLLGQSIHFFSTKL